MEPTKNNECDAFLEELQAMLSTHELKLVVDILARHYISLEFVAYNFV